MRHALVLAFAASLFSTGCYAHSAGVVYTTEYDDGSGYDASYTFMDPHPVPDAFGGGWCPMDGLHVHTYLPDTVETYTVVENHYVYGGPTVVWYVDLHPLPAGGSCGIYGRHSHDFAPTFHRSSFAWDGRGRGYRYRHRASSHSHNPSHWATPAPSPRPPPYSRWNAPSSRPHKQWGAHPSPKPPPGYGKTTGRGTWRPQKPGWKGPGRNNEGNHAGNRPRPPSGQGFGSRPAQPSWAGRPPSGPREGHRGGGNFGQRPPNGARRSPGRPPPGKRHEH